MPLDEMIGEPHHLFALRRGSRGDKRRTLVFDWCKCPRNDAVLRTMYYAFGDLFSMTFTWFCRIPKRHNERVKLTRTPNWYLRSREMPLGQVGSLARLEVRHFHFDFGPTIPLVEFGNKGDATSAIAAEQFISATGHAPCDCSHRC